VIEWYRWRGRGKFVPSLQYYHKMRANTYCSLCARPILTVLCTQCNCSNCSVYSLVVNPYSNPVRLSFFSFLVELGVGGPSLFYMWEADNLLTPKEPGFVFRRLSSAVYNLKHTILPFSLRVAQYGIVHCSPSAH
jgi:hypothetical protein